MNNIFGETLKNLRISKGLSQKQLAEMIFVDRSTIASWETGRRIPDATIIIRLSEILGVDTSVLLGLVQHNNETPNVIIVDDEQIVLNGSLAILKEALPDMNISALTRPSEALAFVSANHVSIAFLDIEMGKMSGLELSRQLLKIDPYLNIIFLTAYMDYSFDAWKTKASGFLLKPLTVEDVHEQLLNLRHPLNK